ncbi:MAG: serine hydrolase domain-containing protein [Acidobacteriota bacterium]
MRATFTSRHSLCFVILLFACVSIAHATDPGAEASRLLAAALAEDRGPGAMAAVVRDGEVIWSDAVGWADLEAKVALTPDSLLRTGSVAKPLTAALVARLVAAGKLDIDAPVQKRVVELPHEAITARHLGTHTSGIRHYDFTNYDEANNTRFHTSLDEALATFLDDPLLTAPGQAFHYSSFGYNLLGVVAARAAEGSYAGALATWLTEPLGLDGIRIDHPLDIVPRRGRFYTIKPDGTVINTIWRDSSDYYPSGGLLATAEDLARFTWACFRGPLLDGAPRQLFTTPGAMADGDDSPYSFGWQVERDDDGAIIAYQHGGETNGAAAIVRFDPATGIAVAGLANYNFWYDGEPAFYATVSERIPALFAADHAAKE